MPRTIRFGGLDQLTVRVKPAAKKRAGRNPATGEEITIAAKPASATSERVRWRKGSASIHPEGAGVGLPRNGRASR